MSAQDEAAPPSAGAAGSTITATWTFDASAAPAMFSIATTEVFTDAPDGAPGTEIVAATSAPTQLTRTATGTGVQWTATVSLAAPVAGRGFRLRPTHGSRLDIGTPAPAPATVKGPEDPLLELARLRDLLDQQPDHGRAILERLMPSADPDELRAQIDAALDTKAVWPFVFGGGPVDAAALDAFIKAYNLPPIEIAQAADRHFQTKEDWARYATAKGAAWFMIGGDVDEPLSASLENPSGDMTYDVRPGEVTDDGFSVAMFSDNGNGLHASLSIARQVVDSGLPYAFHLGDVYYGGTASQFHDYFAQPLEPMLDRTEFFMIAGNHEMFGSGTEYNKMVRAKREAHPARQRQRAETFRLRGPGFQLIGLDTMFIGWRAGHMRLHDYADDDALDLLAVWLAERPDDLTILMTTNEAWDFGSADTTRLYNSLRETIAGRVDVWFWGNVHYGALYNPWTFADTGSPRRQVITTCIGHGGYPFYTEDYSGKLPPGVVCRWKEIKSRFWPEQRVRSDVGLNGWCRLNLKRDAAAWNVNLTYLDWVGRERLRANLVRPDGDTIRFASVEESDIAAVGAPPTWNARG